MNNKTGRKLLKDEGCCKAANRDQCADLRGKAVMVPAGSTYQRTADVEELFAAGKMPFARYISAKKNVVLSGSYTLDSPVTVDGEELVLSGTDQPLIIDVGPNQAFSVVHKGRLTLTNVVLRQQRPRASLNHDTALIRADDGSTIELRDCVITSASGRGITIAHSAIHATRARIMQCKGEGLVLQNSTAVLKECAITENGSSDKTYAQILLAKSTAMIEKCIINDSKGGPGIAARKESKIGIAASTIQGNAGNGLSVKHASTLELKDCAITENGTTGRLHTQIYIAKSFATIEKCRIHDSKGGGITIARKSTSEITASTIRGNAYNGLSVNHASTLALKDCTITKNGSEGKTYAQIYLEKSVATIEKCSITDSRGGPGIAVFNASKIGITASTIRNNADNGLSVYHASALELRDCTVTKNGNEGDTYAQIYLDQSTATIENNTISDSKWGFGIYIHGTKRLLRKDLFCDVIVRNTRLERNNFGLRVERPSRLRISDCTMLHNVAYDTFFDKGAIITVCDEGAPVVGGGTIHPV
jgi:hypothetical protein